MCRIIKYHVIGFETVKYYYRGESERTRYTTQPEKARLFTRDEAEQISNRLNADYKCSELWFSFEEI